MIMYITCTLYTEKQINDDFWEKVSINVDTGILFRIVKIYKLLKLNEKISFFIHFIYKIPSFIVFIICKCMLSVFSYNPYIMYKCTSHCIYGMYRAILIEKYKFINMRKNLA
jgi:hypothetical protein